MSTTQREAWDHYVADTEALGADETLDTEEPVAWITGMETPDPETADEVRASYRRLREMYDGRPPVC